MKYLLLLFTLFSSCSIESNETINLRVEELSTTIAYNQIDGVDPNRLSLDIYYNSRTAIKKPVVIWVHGGGWRTGDKQNKIDDKVSLCRSLNYLLVSVNYRLSPSPVEPNNPNRIKYPTHNNDVADAIKWVYDNIDQYGGNPDKIALMGHSAGGHLVSLTGTNERFLSDRGLRFANIKGVASIDSDGYDVLAKVQENNSLYINAFGINEQRNQEASPIYNVEADKAHPKFFVAKRGTPSRIASIDAFITTLEDNGVSVTQVDGSVYSHSEINTAIGAPNETVITEPLKAFLAECFE
ncbi:MAG: carboxylesterase family protein [Thermonemataceae bacterium]